MNRRFLLPALGIVLATWMLPEASLAQDGRSIFSALDTQGRTVAVGEEMNGNLVDGDVLSAGGRRVQVWTLGVSPGEEVQVDLRSDEFDSFLYVVGPGLNEGLRDDDGGSGLNSRVCFVPERAGDYRVVASSLNAGTGAFSIAASATGGDCGGAVATNEVDDVTTLSPEGRVLSVGDDAAGSLTDADPTLYGSPVQAWAVQGSAGAAFSVDLISDDFDSFLTLVGPGDTWFDDDDSAGRCDSRISLTFPESGEYLVVVSTLGTGTGTFRLVASEHPGPVNPESCNPFDEGGFEGEYEYIEGSLTEISFEGSLDMEGSVNGSMRGDEGYFRDRPLQGWTIDGMAGNIVAITLISDQFDTYLFFDGPGFPDPLSDDDSAGDLDSRICVELPESGRYNIYAGPLSSADPGSPYRLEATVRNSGELCGDYFERAPAVRAAELASATAGAATIGVNEERTGSLTGSLIHPESERPIEAWTLRGEPGTFLYVDVVSDMFDAYLYALGDGIDGVRTADDTDGSRNPRMEITIPASGEVTLLASSFGTSARGDYLLRASTNPPPLEMSSGSGGGGVATGSLTDASEIEGIGFPVADLPPGGEFSGVLGMGDDVISRGYAQAFTYQGAAGETVAFELISDDFDCYLYLTGPGLAGVLSDDDGASGSLDSRIQVTLPEDGLYTIVVSALSEGSEGSFRLLALRPVS